MSHILSLVWKMRSVVMAVCGLSKRKTMRTNYWLLTSSGQLLSTQSCRWRSKPLEHLKQISGKWSIFSIFNKYCCILCTCKRQFTEKLVTHSPKSPCLRLLQGRSYKVLLKSLENKNQLPKYNFLSTAMRPEKLTKMLKNLTMLKEVKKIFGSTQVNGALVLNMGWIQHRPKLN